MAASPAERLRAISGSVMLTMLESSVAMKVPSAATTSMWFDFGTW
jgi:hypothetical protein